MLDMVPPMMLCVLLCGTTSVSARIRLFAVVSLSPWRISSLKTESFEW